MNYTFIFDTLIIISNNEVVTKIITNENSLTQTVQKNMNVML